MEKSKNIEIVSRLLDQLQVEIEEGNTWVALDYLDELRGCMGRFRDETEVTTERILNMVCTEFGITPEQLKLRCNEPKYVLPRHAFMYILNQYAPHLTLAEIGEIAGGFDHATVIHAKKAINNYLETDRVIRARLEALFMNVELMLNEHFPEHEPEPVLEEVN